MSNAFSINISSPADREEIKKAAKEAAGSLLRIESERDLMKEIATKIKEEYEVPTSQFNKLVKLYHKQNKEEEEAKVEAIIELYEQIFE